MSVTRILLVREDGDCCCFRRGARRKLTGQEDLQSRGGGGGDSDALRLVELQRWCSQDRERLVQKHPAIESEDPGAASSYPRGSQPGQASCCREEVLLFQGLRNERERAQPTLLRTNFHKVIKQARIFLYIVNLRGETNLKDN